MTVWFFRGSKQWIQRASFQGTTLHVDWGDGTTNDYKNGFTAGAPVHTYKEPGIYNISLTSDSVIDCDYCDFSNMFESFTNLIGISGSLGAIFSGQQLEFQRAFHDTNIKTLPEHLFTGIYGQPRKMMFMETFMNCKNLTGPIPETLFEDLDGEPTEKVFSGTFNNTSITQIPEGLFSSIKGPPAQYMFQYTFQNTAITEIPKGLFSSIKGPPALSMFFGTFNNTSITEIPEGLFSSIQNSSNGNGYSAFSHTFANTPITKLPAGLFANINSDYCGYMFNHTFYGCRELTSIPEDLFDNISCQLDTSSRGTAMFMSTFSGCTGLTSIPAGLFKNISGKPGRIMFRSTFENTSITQIPKGLFDGIQGPPAQQMFQNTFKDTKITSIPENLFSGISGAPATGMFSGTFSGCTNISGSIPAGLFDGIAGAPAENMFFNTFTGCTGLQSYIPDTTFSGIEQYYKDNNLVYDATNNNYFDDIFTDTNLLTQCPVNMYQHITGFEGDWSSRVSCSNCPSTHPLSEAGSTSINQCYKAITCENIVGQTLVSGDKEYYDGTNNCVYKPAIYTITYDYTNGGSGCDNDTYTAGTTKNLSCVPVQEGYIFTGWFDADTNGNKVASITIADTGNKTFYAQWTPVEFTITTTNMSANSTFSFSISAAGTFYVDWGDGIVETINKTNTTETTYSHTYTTAGVHTIGMAGQATEYYDYIPDSVRTDTSINATFIITPAISFYGNTNIASISGSLGAIFGTLSSGTTVQPRFSNTFEGCTNLSGTIPHNLFYGIYGAPIDYMFFATFYRCENLKGNIPEDLFSGISGAPAEAMFRATFSDCPKLSGSIPEKLFCYDKNNGVCIQGEPAKAMFGGTFYNCAGLTGNIPENLFTGISGAPAFGMFGATFAGCSNLSGSIPAGLFDGIAGAPADNMFYSTFYGSGLQSYIPDTTFSGIEQYYKDNNLVYDATNNTYFDYIFTDTNLLTQCPANMYQHITGFEGDWSSKVSCSNCPSTHPLSVAGTTSIDQCYKAITCEEKIGQTLISGDKEYYDGTNNCVYEPNTYTIEFNGNNATSGGTTSVTCTYDTNCILTTNGYEKTGYTFTAWNTEADGTGTSYTDGDTVINLTSTNNGTVTLYAQWGSKTYTIKYVDEDGKTLTTTNPTTWIYGETQQFDLVPPTLEDGMSFNGWFTTNPKSQEGQVLPKTTQITTKILDDYASDNNILTLYARVYPSPVFGLTTTETNIFKVYYQNTAGTLWVDWGDGSVQKFSNSGNNYITHNYTESKTHNISFSSRWTKYNVNSSPYESFETYAKAYNNYAQAYCIPSFALGWRATPEKIKTIWGSLGKLFPSLQDETIAWYYRHPNLCQVLSDTVNLESEIPEGFLDGITNVSYMGVAAMFYNSSIHGKIPEDLFNSFEQKNVVANDFYLLFANCPNIEGKIPETLFDWVNGDVQKSAFYATFYNTPKLTGNIPENLFKNLTGTAPVAFAYTFSKTPGLTGSIPNNLFKGISGEIKESMFEGTFDGATGLTGKIPEDLFARITGTATNGFNGTFKGCTNLGKTDTEESTPIPENLFARISGTIDSSNKMFVNTFADTSRLSGSVPKNLFKNITGYLSNNEAGTQTSTYISGGMTGIFNNSSINTSCPANDYQYITGFEADWNDRVSCETCPTEFPKSDTGDNVTIAKCYTDCDTDPANGEYISGHKYYGKSGEGDQSSCDYKYTITYDLKGVEATNTSNPTEYTKLMTTDINLSAPTTTNEHYTFEGWCTDETLLECSLTQTITTGTTGNKIFYAQWSTDEYTITYENLENSTHSNPGTYTIESEAITFTAPTEREGYTFTGWTEDNTTIEGIISGTTGNKTITANWEPNIYTIEFNGNEATSGETTSATCTYDTNCTLTTNGYTRTGYTFNGWNTAADGSGTSYEDGASVINLTATNNGTVTVYAQWAINTYNIIYELNEGDPITEDIPSTYTYEDDVTINSTPTKTGYTFIGWYDALEDGNEVTEIRQGSTGNVTVYAQWAPKLYNITYNLNNGINYANAPTSYTIESNSITFNTPTKDGYVFEGWYSNSEYTREPITTLPQGSTGNKILYAKWNTIFCPAGQYKVNNVCTICPNDNYCPGDNTKVNCPEGLVSTEGRSTIDECGKILHVDEDILYLTSKRQTLPALAVLLDGNVYYGRMRPASQGRVSINSDTEVSLKANVAGTEYYIHDNSITTGE